MHDYRPHRAVAERAARQAGALLLENYGRVAAREKAPGDLVTEADSASQTLISQVILDTFPDHTIMGEEDGSRPDPSNPWRWVIDPIDGTINFAHGFPFWCVSIALVHQTEVVVGVILDPLANRLFGATRGQGADLDGRRLQVSQASSLRESLIATGLPTGFAADAPRQLALMGRMSSGTHGVRRSGSSALNMAYVALGGLDVFYATSIHPWDVLAGVLLVLEAGGTITAMNGDPFDLYGRQILATNGRVHQEAVETLREAWPG